MLECVFDKENKLVFNLFQFVIQSNNIPMGIYLRRNIAWVGDTTMAEAMPIFLTGSITVEIIFHQLLTTANFENRKELAAYCEKELVWNKSETKDKLNE